MYLNQQECGSTFSLLHWHRDWRTTYAGLSSCHRKGTGRECLSLADGSIYLIANTFTIWVRGQHDPVPVVVHSVFRHRSTSDTSRLACWVRRDWKWFQRGMSEKSDCWTHLLTDSPKLNGVKRDERCTTWQQWGMLQLFGNMKPVCLSIFPLHIACVMN